MRSAYASLLRYVVKINKKTTLRYLINVGLRLLILALFSHAYGLIRQPTFINFSCFFQGLRLFDMKLERNEIKFCRVFNFHTFETKVTLDQKKIHFSLDEKEFRCTFVLKYLLSFDKRGLRLLVFPIFPKPTFISQPTFIKF